MENSNELILLTDPEKAEIAMNSIAGLPEVMAKNQNSVDRASAAAQALIDEAAKGMTDELDTKLNDTLVKFRKTKEVMGELRKPATNWWNNYVLKRFTELENKMDTGAGTLAGQMQKIRNDYAAKKIEDKKIADAALKSKQDSENERIRVKSEVQKQFNDYSNAYQAGKLRDLTAIFESQTLEFFDKAHIPIDAFPDHPAKAKDFDFKYQVKVVFIKNEEAGDIAERETGALKITFGRTFSESIKAKKAELIEKLPGKKKELEEIEKAAKAAKAAAEQAALAKSEEEKQKAAKAAQDAAAETKRLADEAEKRKTEEAQKALEDAEKLRLEGEAKANEQASVEQAVVSFDLHMDGASAAPTKGAGTVKEEVKIKVLKTAGWMLIFQYYYKNEGMGISIEDFGKKKMDSMLTFCEKNVDKYGKIDSDLISYGTEIKTSARK